jgi:Mce-associated membrane protein
VLTEPPPRRGMLPVYGLVALVVLLAAAATYFVIAWTQARDDWTAANDSWVKATNDLLRAESDTGAGFAKVRDEATKAGRAEVMVFNTVDHRKVDEGLDNWEKSSTGALHDEVTSRRASTKQAIESARSATTAEALGVALTELDAPAGKATMIAAVKVTVTAEGKQPQERYLRIQVALQRTADGWKLSGISQIPAGG